MFKRAFRTALAFGLVLTFASGPAFALEPSNLYPRKQELVAYINSGDYAKDVAAVALKANKYLVKRIPKGAKGKKLAIVFDIDETTLTNLAHITANDFGYVPKTWDSWVAEGRAPAIIPVQTIYDTAVRGKIDVFFISGRKETDRASTERNLRDVGYETWTKIFFKPTTDIMLTTAGFKIDVRRQLTKEGYVIVANVGDQNSDLVGGYAERIFKLPNPFYITK
jgi:predicted secreted acid phosphatase